MFLEGRGGKLDDIIRQLNLDNNKNITVFFRWTIRKHYVFGKKKTVPLKQSCWGWFTDRHTPPIHNKEGIWGGDVAEIDEQERFIRWPLWASDLARKSCLYSDTDFLILCCCIDNRTSRVLCSMRRFVNFLLSKKKRKKRKTHTWWRSGKRFSPIPGKEVLK